jgi:hypothetical protein
VALLCKNSLIRTTGSRRIDKECLLPSNPPSVKRVINQFFDQ